MDHSSSISKSCAKYIALYKNFVIYCILALITVLVYWRSLYYPFQFDDLPNIVNYVNLKSRSLNSLFFAQTRWVVTYLNVFLYQYYQSSSFVCRLINLIIHLINGLLVFNLILRFKDKLSKQINYLATCTTSLFLLHPVQTQTISYVIQGQLEGLASLFTLLTILSFCNYTQINHKYFKFLNYISMLVCLLLATGSKEIAVVTPFLILLVDWFLIDQGNLQALKQRIWLFFTLFILTFSIYFYYLKPTFFWQLITWQQTVTCNDGNLLANHTTSISQYIFLISQFKVILHYLTIFIWPLTICMEYDWQLSTSFWEIDCLIPFCILSCLGILMIYLLKKDRTHPGAFGLLWFLICILPRSSIIASGELLVDYKTYLASVGWLFTITYFMNLLIIKLTRPSITNFIRKLALLALIFILSILSLQRNQVWSSARSFWYDVIIKAPKKARGFNNYGMALVEEGLYQQSIFYFKHAITLNMHSQTNQIYLDPYKNLANAYALSNQIDLAITIIKQALKIYPDNATLHGNLGALLLHQKDYHASIEHLQYAVKLNPKLEQALYTLGKAYLAINQPLLAWQILHRGNLETHLDRNPAALELYAQASIEINKLNDALKALQKLISLQPNNLKALFNLGSVYYFMQNHLEAIKCYQAILKLDPTNQAARDKLKLLT